MAVIKGNISKLFPAVTNLDNCVISVSEVDSKKNIISYTDNAGNYSIELSAGSWRITITPAGQPPKYIGVLPITDDSPADSIDKMLVDISASSLDITVLGHLFNLIEAANRAADSVKIKLATIQDKINETQIRVSEEVKTSLINSVKSYSDSAATNKDIIKGYVDSISGGIQNLQAIESAIRDINTDLDDKINRDEFDQLKGNIPFLKDEDSIKQYNALFTPERFFGNFDLCTIRNNYFYESQFTGVSNNHPMTDKSGTMSQGFLTCVHLQRLNCHAQFFLTQNNEYFYRVYRYNEWLPWWQLGGEPVTDNLGTFVFALLYGFNNLSILPNGEISGSSLKVYKNNAGERVSLSGAWKLLGSLFPSGDTNTAYGLFMRVR